MCLLDGVLVLQRKRMSSEQSEVRMQFAGRSPCFTRETHEQRAKRGANAVCRTKRSGRKV